MIVPMIGFGQLNFPSKEVQLLIGKTLTVKAYTIDYAMGRDTNYYSGYRGFYKNKKLRRVYRGQTTSPSSDTEYEALVGKKFKVIDFKYVENETSYDYLLTLDNDDIGILYYNYESDYDWRFPFIVEGGIELSDYCSNIRVLMPVDKFTGLRSVKPYENEIGSFTIHKEFNWKEYKFYSIHQDTLTGVELRILQNSYEYESSKGLILLLENNLRIEKPDEQTIVMPNNRVGAPYSHITRFFLNDNEIKLLSENMITDYRLGLVDGAMDPSDAFVFMKTMLCFLKKSN